MTLEKAIHETFQAFKHGKLSTLTGPILESKGMRVIFPKKGKKGQNI